MVTNHEDVVSYLESGLGLDVSGIDPSSDLFADGLLDSFSIASLVTFLEEKGRFKFTLEEVNLDNLGTVERIVTYVNRRASGDGNA